MPTNTQSRITAIVAVLAGFVALSAWALSAPVGASPDDGRHLPSIWCAHGERPGICRDAAQGGGMVIVPFALAGGHSCYAGDPTKSAACRPDQDVPLPQQPEALADASFLYQTPALFYWTMGWLVDDNVERSVMVIRFTNILLTILLVAGAALLSSGSTRLGVILAWLITPIPLGLSIIPSTNPSAWAIVGIGTLWAFLFAHWEADTTRKRVIAGAGAALAAAIAIGGRTDSAAYVVLVVLATAVVHFGRHWRSLRTQYPLLIVPIIASVVATIVFGSRPQSAVAVDGMGNKPAVENQIGLLVRNTMDLPSLWLGSFGDWALGYFDIAIPIIVVFIVGTSFFGLVLMGIRYMSWPKTLGMLTVFAGISVLPLWVLQLGNLHVGEELQPRYFLPLLFPLLGIALAAPPATRVVTLRLPQKLVLALALTAATSAALLQQIRRFSVGDGTVEMALRSPEWWSQDVLPPTVVFAMGTLGFALWAICALRSLPGDDERIETARTTV